MGEAAHQGEIIAIGCGFNSGWGEDILLYVVWKTLAADPFHNRNEKLEAGDGPIPLLSRLIHPILPGVERHDLIERLGLAAGGFDRVAKVVVVNDAGSVIEQLANAYAMAL